MHTSVKIHLLRQIRLTLRRHFGPIRINPKYWITKKYNAMNPLNWKSQHLVVWAAFIAAGAAGGMIFAWAVSPFSHLAGADTQTMFFAFLHYPWTYWPYVGAGAVTAGAAYYSADLLTGFR